MFEFCSCLHKELPATPREFRVRVHVSDCVFERVKHYGCFSGAKHCGCALLIPLPSFLALHEKKHTRADFQSLLNRVVNNFTIDFTDTFTTSPLGWGIYVSKFSMIRNSPTLVLGCGRGRDDTYHPHPSELGAGTYHFLILSPPAHLGGGFTYQGTGGKTYHE